MTRLSPPEITRTDEALRSDRFGDIYFQEADGLAETRHVFLDGNRLGTRFRQLSSSRPFVVGELGFGTGLNFLATAHLFEAVAPPEARLDYWAVEGFPFEPHVLDAIHTSMEERWPDLSGATGALRAGYPLPRPGLAQIDISDRITLTLAFGDVRDMQARSSFAADAWFLDGFSPARNPDMWQADVLAAIAAHSKPSCTVATFTVAGDVRRGLTAAGFEIEKSPGFGRKREMLRGQMGAGVTSQDRPAERVAIVGAGIAGACLVHEARRRGIEPVLIDPGGRAAGASGNPAGLLMPRIEAADNAAARFYRDAYLFAQRFYETYTPSALKRHGGVLHDDAGRLEKVAATGLWREDDFRVDRDSLTATAAAILHPVDAVRQLTEGIEVRRSRVLSVDPGLVSTADGNMEVDAVIVAAGPASAALLGFAGDISASRGQVDVFDGPIPPRIVTDGTYVAPFETGLIAGATYDPAVPDDIPTPDDKSTVHNRRAAEALTRHNVGASVTRRAALRATTRDRHPIAGPLDSGSEGHNMLCTLTGLGSRGLVTAPILARHLLCQLTGGISPLEAGAQSLTAPRRFAERRRRRHQG